MFHPLVSSQIHRRGAEVPTWKTSLFAMHSTLDQNRPYVTLPKSFRVLSVECIQWRKRKVALDLAPILDRISHLTIHSK